MKRVLKSVLCLLIGLLFLLPINTYAKDARLHDETGQLSSDQYNQILQMLDDYSQRHEIDICINVVNDTDGLAIDDYGNEMFDRYGYGYDEDYSCILLTIDMGSRKYYHTTDITGKGFNYISDYSIDNLGTIFAENYGNYGLYTALCQWINEVDVILSSAENGNIIDVELGPVVINIECDKYIIVRYNVYDFSGQMITTLECTNGANYFELPIGEGYLFICSYISNGYYAPDDMYVYVNNTYTVTTEPQPINYFHDRPIAAGIGAIVAAIYSAILAGKNKSVSRKYDASQYLQTNSVNYSAVHDNFLYKNVVRSVKPKNDDDHHDSSSSFGGSSF
ncbi:MAG: TPM domain-containing protein, partial [Erysipelotrichaceae bacterium]